VIPRAKLKLNYMLRRWCEDSILSILPKLELAAQRHLSEAIIVSTV
jgi:hypothetical protein